MVTLSRFEMTHLEDLKTWSYHEDLRFIHYDFKGFTDLDYKRWYKRKQRTFTKRLFAVTVEGTLVGFITMKHIRWHKKEATLGIIFNPSVLNKGYGTSGLGLFLDYYFTTLGFNQLKLCVTDFNRRAMHVYKSLGFEVAKTRTEPFEDQSHNFDLILHHQDVFTLKDTTLYTVVHDMFLSKDKYEENIKLKTL